MLRGGRRGDRQQRAHAARGRGADRPAAGRARDPPGRRPAGARRDGATSPTLVTVAHLEPHKNQADVIRALAALAAAHPGLRYVLVGKGPDARGAGAPRALARASPTASAFHRRAAARGARSRARALPRPRDAERRTTPSASRTSRRWRPGCRRSAAPGPARRTSPRRGRGSCSCPPGDLPALARAIDGLLSDPARARAGSARPRAQTVAEHFTWKRNGARDRGSSTVGSARPEPGRPLAPPLRESIRGSPRRRPRPRARRRRRRGLLRGARPRARGRAALAARDALVPGRARARGGALPPADARSSATATGSSTPRASAA